MSTTDTKHLRYEIPIIDVCSQGTCKVLERKCIESSPHLQYSFSDTKKKASFRKKNSFANLHFPSESQGRVMKEAFVEHKLMSFIVKPY
jgi:hypothetical protein